MKKIIYLLIGSIILVSCKFKEEKAIDDLPIIGSEFADQNFYVSFDAIVEKEDDFALLYTVDGSIDFATNPAIWQHIKGSSDIQKLLFILPYETVPTEIRLDMGMNLEQPDVIITGFSMTYRGKTFEAKGIEVFKYFTPDLNHCDVQPNTGKVIAKIENGKRKTPILYPVVGMLDKQIEKLSK